MIEVFKITHNIYDAAISPGLSFHAKANYHVLLRQNGSNTSVILEAVTIN